MTRRMPQRSTASRLQPAPAAGRRRELPESVSAEAAAHRRRAGALRSTSGASRSRDTATDARRRIHGRCSAPPVPTASCRRSSMRRRCSTCCTPRSATHHDRCRHVAPDPLAHRRVARRLGAARRIADLRGGVSRCFRTVAGYRAVLGCDRRRRRAAESTRGRGGARARARAVRLRRAGHDRTARSVPSRGEHVPLDVPGAGRPRSRARLPRLVAVVLRNVLERRRELALLGAAGFTGGDCNGGRDRTGRPGRRGTR